MGIVVELLLVGELDKMTWKPTKAENSTFKCRICGSDDVWYDVDKSDCGGFEDYHYHCKGCDRKWWVESSDS